MEDVSTMAIKFFFGSGATWEAVTVQSDQFYQLVAVNANLYNSGYFCKMVTWAREERRGEKDKKIRERCFRLQILDRNFHALPLTVIVTRNSISLVYQNQQQKTFLPAAVWVASSEGWLP